MWIAALATSVALLLPGQLDTGAPVTRIASAAYNACIYNCVAACGEVYTDVRACEKKRQLCKRDCIIKYPTEFTGYNKSWMPTATGCKCIKPLLSNGICPR